MASIEVATLRLRCPTRQRERARFALEDALRTALPDDGRLVLVRGMRIGPAASGTDPWRRQEAVRAGWLAAVAGARHGNEDGAGGANCVWFESRGEAEALLLRRLLAGRAVDAWFWKLALPSWKDQPLREWLHVGLIDALAKGDDRRVLETVGNCVAAGAAGLLVEILAGAAAPGPGTAPEPAQRARESPTPTGRPAHGQPADQIFMLRVPPRIALPPELRKIAAVLYRLGGEARAIARAVLRAWALRQSPALSLSTEALAETVAAMMEGLSEEFEVPTRSGTEAVVEPAPAERDVELDGSSGGEAIVRASPVPIPEGSQWAETSSAPDAATPPPREEQAPAPIAPEFRRPQPSRHAGLWLVVPSLLQLGIREWLAERTELLVEHPGGLLLHAIARHHRIAPEDPVLRVLGEPPAPEKLPEWAYLWRHGLDRWLRRTAGRRLHDLVNRPGMLAWDELSLDIRYPGADADIALRRRALDRDPGWTDWLGLSIRYHFGAEEERP